MEGPYIVKARHPVTERFHRHCTKNHRHQTQQTEAPPPSTYGIDGRYLTSGELLEDLTAALADQTIHDRVRYYAKFDLPIIDEFGFDRIERSVRPQAASLWYKIIDA